MSDLETIAEMDSVNWSMPKHTMVDDVVFWQVSANAGDRAARYRRAGHRVDQPSPLRITSAV
jgi:hypothetical protein